MITKFINKFIGLYVLIRHYNVSPELRSFYKDTYRCQLVQWKYVIKDYIIKKPYKKLSFQGEFAPELQFVLPFAYWHYKNGTLKQTESSIYTREFYFFSPHHEEVFETRSNEGNYNYEMPRILYSHRYNMRKWAPVPLKEHYRNSLFQFKKPGLVIANRYNMEWGGPPISYFDIPTLSYLIEQLQGTYTLIYNRPRATQITMDNSDIYELNEHDWIRQNYPEVVMMEDLYQQHKAHTRNFNHFQLMVYANCDRFISIHGGTATLASYFGGLNLIFSKQGPEHHFKCYEKLYPKLSGATILHAKDVETLKKYVDKHFITRANSEPE